jgi:hypothetical protein
LANSPEFLGGDVAAKSIGLPLALRVDGLIDLQMGILPQVSLEPLPQVLTDLRSLLVSGRLSRGYNKPFKFGHARGIRNDE